MRTAEEIDAEISILTEQMNAVQGTETEVYTRIVGYYRNIKNWNPGKTAEFQDRKYFKVKGE
jgi:anaerobic ribonucleoside-triphosphate reductase